MPRKRGGSRGGSANPSSALDGGRQAVTDRARLAAMKIYGGYKSFTRDCRPRWLLEELGMAYERIHVDIFAGEGRASAYLAKNPLGKVPFLEDGDAGIFESGAIVAYLADRYGIPRVSPELTSPRRAEYLQW